MNWSFKIKSESEIKRNWTDWLKKNKQTRRHGFACEVFRLTPAHPPAGIVQGAETWGRQDLSNRVVGAQFQRFAPQTLEPTQSFGSDHWFHISKVLSKGGPTDTFFKHSPQLLLAKAQGPAHRRALDDRSRTQSRKQNSKTAELSSFSAQS